MTVMSVPNQSEMESYWLPFTPNRQFKANPRLFVGADGMYYTAADGKRILDGMAGLWCVNAGHNQRPIVEAIKQAAEQLDYVSSFQMGHPLAFEAAARIAGIAPAGMDHVFFANSGSEAVDTALKIARAYFRVKGEVGRTRFIGRAKGYHGMGWGGLSVAGIGRHRKDFGPLLPETDHLPHTLNLEHTAFSRGQPVWGAHLADELETLTQIHDPSSIAAVIIEPVTGSGGVLPPPQGYLERLRAICDRHGILLIFDEVITGFGRLGAPFAASAFGVTPDLITCAKGMTNGAVPMGGVIAGDKVWNAFMAGPESMIELFHGYTYSGHPLACAASIATLDVYRDQGIFERAAKTAPLWEEAAHALKGLPNMIDIRNIGLLVAIELAPRPAGGAARSIEAANLCFDKGVLVRSAGDALVLSPPLIISPAEIDQLFTTVADAIKRVQ
ncbi:MAG TPA: aspartate aminotransferase family protein [Vineibacter sp.]|nr:aspartate aminotransferase family protein [Vineibacter sp.]